MKNYDICTSCSILPENDNDIEQILKDLTFIEINGCNALSKDIDVEGDDSNE